MEKDMRTDGPNRGRLIVNFAISALFIALSSFFGEVLMPFAAAFYAVLLYLELSAEKQIPVCSIICGLLSILFNIFLFSPISIFGIAAVIFGIIIYIMYKFGMSKCDTSILITLLNSFFIFISFIFIAFELTDIYTLKAAFNYYAELYEFLKSEFVFRFMQMYSAVSEEAIGILITEEMIAGVFDAFIKTLPSVIMIIAFIFTGISLKVYTAVLRRYHDSSDRIYTWNFSMPTLYAYFYILIYILSLFVKPEGAFGLTLINLSGLMLFMFAYTGVKFANRFLRDKGHPKLAVVLPVFGIFVFGSLAIDILSVVGVICTLNESKNSNHFNQSNTNL